MKISFMTLGCPDRDIDTICPLAMPDGWQDVAPGTGELPLAESIGLLREGGYDGWLLLEHEKRWHPDLPEPEEAFPRFVDWVRPLLDSTTGG